MGLHEKVLPSILNCEDPEPQQQGNVSLLIASSNSHDTNSDGCIDPTIFLKNSFGFGGINVSLLLKRYSK